MQPSTSLRNQRRVQAESVGEFMIGGRNQTIAKQSMCIGPIGFSKGGQNSLSTAPKLADRYILVGLVAKMEILV